MVEILFKDESFAVVSKFRPNGLTTTHRNLKRIVR